jgi:SAM-dependent methyltransferase
MNNKHNKYSPEDNSINARIYNGFLQLNLDDGWSRFDKFENFEYLIKLAEYSSYPLNKATILDVGCGTGDLYFFLQKYGIKEYTGIDIFEDAVNKAGQKYPEGKFIVGDFLEYPENIKFDFVFCSGAMTTKLSSNNYKIIETWIPKMWEMSKKGIAFNFLVEQFDGQNFGSLFLYNAERVFEIIRQKIPQAQIKTFITPAGAGDTLDEMHVYLF